MNESVYFRAKRGKGTVYSLSSSLPNRFMPRLSAFTVSFLFPKPRLETEKGLGHLHVCVLSPLQPTGINTHRRDEGGIDGSY